MLDDLIDPPEFNLPTRLAFDNVLPLRDQRCIARAADMAHDGRHRAAEEYRIAAGYGGLSEPSRPIGGHPHA